MNKSKEEIENDLMIPESIKNELVKKTNDVLKNISRVEKFIIGAIDDAVELSDSEITVSEINAALINALKKFNQQEIMRLIN